MEKLSPEFKKTIVKSSEVPGGNLDEDLNDSCPVKRKGTEAKTMLSLKIKKQEEDYRIFNPVQSTHNGKHPVQMENYSKVMYPVLVNSVRI